VTLPSRVAANSSEHIFHLGNARIEFLQQTSNSRQIIQHSAYSCRLLGTEESDCANLVVQKLVARLPETNEAGRSPGYTGMNVICGFLLLCLAGAGHAQPSSSQQTATSLSKSQTFEVMVAPLIRSKRYGPSSMVQLKSGEILIAYDDFTMMGEDSDSSPAYIAGRISEDGGRRWGRPFVLQENTSPLGRMGPASLLRLQNGNIGFVYGEAQMSTADWPYYFRSSSDEAKTWSRPVRITQDRRYYSGNNHRMIQLKSGRLLVPFSFIPDISKRQDYSWESMCYYSDDNGVTWKAGRGVVRMPKYHTGAQEPGLVQLKDGSVLMVIRNQQERVYKAISKDGGDTWAEPEAMEQLVAPVSPATIMRIPSTGDLAIVWNYSPKVRTPLAIAISRDEGKTWTNIRYLEAGYFSYAYASFLFLAESNQLLLSYWVDDTRDRPDPGIGIRVRGIDVAWLYEPQ
jgi:sialidase-1